MYHYWNKLINKWSVNKYIYKYIYLYIYINIYIYIYIYIYKIQMSLPVNAIVKLPHPQSGDSQSQLTRKRFNTFN